MNNREKLYYLAGLLDGEGHFCITKARNGKRYGYQEARIIVNNTDKAMIDWLKENFGGGITKNKQYNIKNKPSWRWQIANSKAVALAWSVQPMLITKLEQSKRLTTFNL